MTGKMSTEQFLSNFRPDKKAYATRVLDAVRNKSAEEMQRISEKAKTEGTSSSMFAVTAASVVAAKSTSDSSGVKGEQATNTAADAEIQPKKSGMSRAGFLRNTTIFLSGAVLFGACRKNPPAPAQNTPYAERGKAAVFYGDALNLSERQTLGRFDIPVIHPTHIRPEDATNVIPKAFAYGALTSLNATQVFNSAAGTPFKLLDQWLNANNGYLPGPGPTGHLPDPLGYNSYMVDLRIPAVRQKMKEYLTYLGQNYGGGVFLDAIDSATLIENTNPTLYGRPNPAQPASATNMGMTDAAVLLMQEVCAAVGSKKAMVNGGLYQRTTTGLTADIATAIGGSASNIAAERQYASLPGTPQSSGTNDWTKGRFTAIAQGAAGKPALTLLAIDPCLESTYDVESCNAAHFYNDLCKAITSVHPIKTKTFACKPVSATDPSFDFLSWTNVTQNLAMTPLDLTRSC